MGYGSKDEEAREDWLTAHPDDPLAIDAKKKREKAMGIKPAPAAETASAAALAKASVKPHVASSGPGQRPTSSAAPATSDPLGMGWGTIAAVGAAVFAMFFLSWIFRSQTITAPVYAGAPGVGNAYVLQEACPAGQVPASLMKVLEPGPIVNDTEEPEPEN
ncbi:MAG TPA: hypothetical protein DEB52_01980 [Hyphomonas sp.]|nr:hypothetical protein [Hyphomonas sp.]|tara:strand:- start:115 stop:597 length:483 start_codon:yes stop_codon:yes gene_type:complete